MILDSGLLFFGPPYTLADSDAMLEEFLQKLCDVGMGLELYASSNARSANENGQISAFNAVFAETKCTSNMAA